jgi:hypothetical protein
MAQPQDYEKPNTRAQQALIDAEEALRQGDRSSAYQLSREATKNAPDNIKAWLIQAESAPTLDEAIACLNQANALQPLNSDLREKTYQTVWTLLKHNPFVLYLDETEDKYHVQSGEQISLVIPKDRSIPEPYPARQPARLQLAYRWLWLALFGIIPAGLGAIIFAPLAGLTALSMNFGSTSRSNRIHSLVLIILSGGLWLFGLLLSVILLVHLI